MRRPVLYIAKSRIRDRRGGLGSRLCGAPVPKFGRNSRVSTLDRQFLGVYSPQIQRPYFGASPEPLGDKLVLKTAELRRAETSISAIYATRDVLGGVSGVTIWRNGGITEWRVCVLTFVRS